MSSRSNDLTSHNPKILNETINNLTVNTINGLPPSTPFSTVTNVNTNQNYSLTFSNSVAGANPIYVYPAQIGISFNPYTNVFTSYQTLLGQPLVTTTTTQAYNVASLDPLPALEIYRGIIINNHASTTWKMDTGANLLDSFSNCVGGGGGFNTVTCKVSNPGGTVTLQNSDDGSVTVISPVQTGSFTMYFQYQGLVSSVPTWIVYA